MIPLLTLLQCCFVYGETLDPPFLLDVEVKSGKLLLSVFNLAPASHLMKSIDFEDASHVVITNIKELTCAKQNLPSYHQVP